MALQIEMKSTGTAMRRFLNSGVHKFALIGLLLAAMTIVTGCSCTRPKSSSDFKQLTLDYSTPVTPALQAKVERIDEGLRALFPFVRGVDGEALDRTWLVHRVPQIAAPVPTCR